MRQLLLVALVVAILLSIAATTVAAVTSITTPSSSSNRRTPYQQHATRKFVWLSDIHLEPRYDPSLGPYTYCIPASSMGQQQQQQWRQLKDNNGNGNTAPTYYFGQFGCDAPYPLVNSAFDDVKRREPEPDFILVSGDFAPHNTLSANETFEYVARVTAMIHQRYPNTPVFPVIGNNDVFPDYNLPLDAYGQYQLKSLYNIWQHWIPEAAADTFLKGGYYSVQFSDKLKVIVLNTLYYSTSWCNGTTPTVADPADQLAWLKAELASTPDYQSVIISGHVPPGYRVSQPGNLWNDRFIFAYEAVVAPYAHKIALQAFGHIHREDFRFLGGGGGQKTSSPTSINSNNKQQKQQRIAINDHNDDNYDDVDDDDDLHYSTMVKTTGSISLWLTNNPSYQIWEYELDGKLGPFTLTDYTMYYVDLVLANRRNYTEWRKGFTFSESYSNNNKNNNEKKKANDDVVSSSVISTEVFEGITDELLVDAPLLNEYIARRTAYYVQQRFGYYCMLEFASSGDYNECLQSSPTS